MREKWEMPLEEYTKWAIKTIQKAIEKSNRITPWYMHYSQDVTNRLHRGIVNQAFREGKKVPSHVLKDYPEFLLKGE